MKIQDPAVRAHAMRITASATPPSGEETVTVTVDGRTVEVPAGASILEAARLAGRLIPTLCHHPDLPDAGVCRVCVVEVSGQRNLQASCAFPITAPVDIQTYSPRVRQARRDVVDLMLAEHCGDCQTCGRNGNCELQDLAAEYGSDIFRFGRTTEPTRLFDTLGPSIIRDMNKCVHCLRCLRTSADLTIIEEGTELLLRLYENLVLGDTSRPVPQFTLCSPGWVKYIEHKYPEYLPNMSSCKSPQQMFGALIKTWYAERNGIDPADVVSVSLMPCTAKKFETARPEMTDSGYADVDLALTTRELGRMIHEHGIYLPDLPESDFDDPFGTASGSGIIFGATGGVMEAALRTVIELVTGLKVEDLFAHADIMPVRGFEGTRYAEITIPDEVGPVPGLLAHLVPDWNWLRGVTLKVAVVHGTANAAKVMEDIKAGGQFSQCHFIEFMACLGGCLGGGGQPIPTNVDIRTARAKAIYAEDAHYGETGRARKSHENPAVLRLYGEFLTDGPCGHTSHKLLHTEYTARGSFIDASAVYSVCSRWWLVCP